MYKNITILIAAFFIITFFSCTNEIEPAFPVGEFDLGNSDNFIVQGTVYDEESMEPLPGAIIELVMPESYNFTHYAYMIADKNGHYRITGIQSWYDYLDRGFGYYSYSVALNHFEKGTLGPDMDNYLPTQNEYMYTTYEVLDGIDLTHPDKVTEVTKNIYVRYMNPENLFKAKLIWDDGTPVKLDEMVSIILKPVRQNYMDGRTYWLNNPKSIVEEGEGLTYNESTGELTINGFYVDGEYAGFEIHTQLGEKYIDNVFNKTVVIDGEVDVDTLLQDKKRFAFVSLKNAQEFDGKYLAYKIGTNENLTTNSILTYQIAPISNGEYIEIPYENQFYHIYKPGKNYYMQAFIIDEEITNDQDWLNGNGFVSSYKTSIIELEVKYSDIDVYVNLTPDDFNVIE